MRNLRFLSMILLAVMAAGGSWGLPASWSVPVRADDADQPAEALLDRPSWQVGDSWVIETVTERIQPREDDPNTAVAKVQWSFVVSKLEQVAGHECYRIDIECLSQGRLRPKTSIWCDSKSLFLRQYQTQLAVAGGLRTVHESYDVGEGQLAPVVTPYNALPVSLPAFVAGGSKSGEFTYVSQPLPAGSKDVGIIRIAHAMSQTVGAPGSKSLEGVPAAYSKEVEAKPLAEVRLNNGRDEVVQVWQKGAPWPVYSDNGRTQATLVSVKRAAQ